MAQRWAQQKLDKERARRDRLAGRSAKAQGWAEGEDPAPGRALPTFTSLEVKHAERVAIEQCNLTAKRAPCTGRLDDTTRKGRTMRKARGEIVRPESGRCAAGQMARKIAAPPMKGFLQSCWSTSTEWKVYTK
jgi:hypothetical protein